MELLGGIILVKYSISRLSKFEECPKAYEFKYELGVEAERVQNIYGFMGSRVHETLELLHEDLRDGKKNSLEELIDYYNKRWSEKWEDEIQVPNDYTPQNFKKTGRECIENYYEKHEPLDQDETIDTELWLNPKIEVDGVEHKFMGVIDRLAITPDGKYVVHDYKTTKNLPTQEEINSDRQLGLYQLGVQQEYPDAEEVELVWHFVRFGKDVRVKRSKRELEELKEKLASVIREIESSRARDEFPTMRGKGANCNWCDYKHLCPEWSHFYETESLEENEFLNEDGVDLVDELVNVQGKLSKLNEKKSELKEKKEKLEEAIIDYAQREEVTSVFGTEKKASIKSRDKIKFPTKNQEGREELEELIRESGKWSEVASLRLSSLKKIARDQEWPRELLDKINEFKEIEKSTRVELEEIND
ncbi:MAG: PD-(D/E)XK nuclease family protein [Hadesarchaea archaeon]|nr:PD-(D/E)XK nuclease family protein [Hadesarchaea archaeon]